MSSLLLTAWWLRIVQNDYGKFSKQLWILNVKKNLIIIFSMRAFMQFINDDDLLVSKQYGVRASRPFFGLHVYRLTTRWRRLSFYRTCSCRHLSSPGTYSTIFSLPTSNQLPR